MTGHLKLLSLTGLLLLAGCASHKRAQLIVPKDCIDALYIAQNAPANPKCKELPNGRCRAQDFEVEYHCVKVKQ